MIPTSVEAMVYGLQTSKKMLHRYVDDLTPEQFEYQPCPGANCVAWCVGHLTLSDRRMLGWLGATDLPSLPDGFEARFQATRTAAAEQGGYGDPKDVVRLFDDTRDRLIAAVRAADPAKFAEPPANPHPLFATRGEMILFMAQHTALHYGQFTIIRRMLGYPPVV